MSAWSRMTGVHGSSVTSSDPERATKTIQSLSQALLCRPSHTSCQRRNIPLCEGGGEVSSRQAIDLQEGSSISPDITVDEGGEDDMGNRVSRVTEDPASPTCCHAHARDESCL